MSSLSSFPFTLDQVVLFAALPYAWWIASIASQARFQAAHKTLPPAETASTATGDAPKEPSRAQKALLFVGIMLFQLAIYLGVTVAMNRLSAVVVDRTIGALAAYCLVTVATPVALNCVGKLDTSLARFADGRLIQHYASLSWPQFIGQAVLAVGVAYCLPLRNWAYYVVLALGTVLVPVSCAVLPMHKTMALRWVFAFYLGIQLAAVCVLAVMMAVIETGIIPEKALDSASDVLTGGEDRTPVEEHDLTYMIGAFLLQPWFYAGLFGVIITLLYRLDVHLAGLKKVGEVALESEEAEEEPTLLPPIIKLLGAKGPSGNRVLLPTYGSLIKKHFRSHHIGLFKSVTYAKLGAFIMLGSVVGASALIRGTMKDDMVGDNVDFEAYFGTQIGFFLSPWLIAIGVAVLALVRGEFKLVYNYREEWTLPAAPANMKAATATRASDDEKASLLTV